MAGFLRAHGVMVCLALALAVVPLAPGAAGAEEPCHHGAAVSSNDSGLTRAAAEGSAPLIRMPTDVVVEGAAEIRHGDAALPQLSRPVEVAIMPGAGVQAAAPADGPSPSGATSVAVSLLACAGMALLGLVLA